MSRSRRKLFPFEAGLQFFLLGTVCAAPLGLPPVAVDDRLELRPGVTNVAFLATANDYDPEGGALSLVSFTQPAHGLVSQNANGTLRYVPAASYNGGSDAFSYTVQDPEGQTATATVVIVTDAALGRDWPTLGGDMARRSSYPGSWSGPLQKKWEYNFSAVESLVVGGGRVFLAASSVSALDAVSGGLAWTQTVQNLGVTGLSYFGEALYATRYDSSIARSLVSLEAGTGALRWATAFPGQFRRFGPPAVNATGVYHGGGEAPVVLSSLSPTSGNSQFQIPVGTSEQWTPSLDDSGVYTLAVGRFRRHDPISGTIVWELVLNSSTTSSAATFALEGRRAYAIYPTNAGGQELAAINLDTRSVQWRLAVSAPPAVRDGLLYVRSGTTVLVVSGASGQVISSFGTPASSAFGLSGLLVTSDRIVVSGTGVDFTPKTYVLDRATGTVLQTLPTGGLLAIADDTLFTADSRVSAYALADPANHPPVAQGGVIALPEEGQLGLQLQASDADGDALSFAVRTLPAAGTLYQTPDGVALGAPITLAPAAVAHPEGRLIYVAPINLFGTAAASFTFTAHDRLSASAPATVQIDIANVNDAPVAVPDLVALRPGETLANFDPRLNDRDADGEIPFLTSFTQASHGIVSRQRDGLLGYVPAPGFIAGTDSFEYTIADAAGLTSTATVTIVVSATLGTEWLTYGGAADRTGYQPVYLGSSVFTPRWQRDLGAPGTQASIKDGGAYLAWGVYGNGARLSRFEALTGAEQWRVSYGSSTAFNQPTVFGDRVYAHPTSNLPFEARALADGTLLWASTGVSVGDRALPPAADEKGVYLRANQTLFGFLPASGAVQFSTPASTESTLAPALYQGGLYNYVHGIVRRHNRSTGASLWSVDLTTSGISGVQNRTLALAGGRAFVVNERSVTSGTSLELVAVDLTAQAVSWRVSGTYAGTPAAAHGAVYAINGSNVIAHDAASGLAFATYAAPGGAVLRVQPILTNDTLIVGSSSQTFVFDLRSRALRQTIPFGGELSLAGNTLFVVGSDNLMRAFNVPTPGNQPPVALPLVSTGPEDAPLVAQLAGSDADNDALSFVITRLPARGRLCQTIDGFTPGSVISEVPARVSSSAGKVVYVPVPDDFGSPVASFGFVATDGKDLSAEATATLNILPVNDAPIARADFRQVVPGQILSPVQERLNDTDVDGDPLSIVSFTQPTLGRVFLNADGSLRYHAPANVASGQDQFTYTVRDPGGLESSATVNIEIVPILQGSWPTYGNGPDHTNASQALLGRAPLVLRWAYNTGNSNAVRQVAVGGGRVYVSTSFSPCLVTALDESTGAVLWQRNFVGSSQNPPSYDNGRVYFNLVNFTGSPLAQSLMIALDAATGQTVWSTSGTATSSQLLHGPAVGPQGVFTATAAGGMSGFERLTGQALFTVPLGNSSVPWSPGLVGQGGLYTLAGGVFRGHNPATGAVLWSLPIPQAGQGSPALSGGRAYLHGGGVRAIDLATYQEIWASSPAASAGDPAYSNDVVFSAGGAPIAAVVEARSAVDGRLLASYLQVSPGFPFTQVVVTDELVIASTNSPATYIFDRASRVERQLLPLGRVSVAGDAVFIATDNGQVLCYAAPPAITFLPLSGNNSPNPVSVTLSAAGPGTIRYTLDGSAPDFDSPVLANGGAVILRASGRIRAILVDGSNVSRILDAAYTITDSDADAIPDWWELQTFGSLGVANANSDTDGDGASDRAEFQAGTDPLAAGDVLRGRVVPVAGGLELSFPSKQGRLYRLEESADLQTWSPLGAVKAGTGATLVEFIPAGPAKRVYRVRVASP